MSRPLFFVLTIASVLTAASRMTAQTPLRVSLEATVGRGVGWTQGVYVGNRSGIAADLLLAVRIRSTAGGALVAGLSASAQGGGAGTDICRPVPTGGCVPRFPAFFSFAPLIGWESGGARLRAMIGPALVQASGEGRTLGVQGRVDVATPPVRRVAVVASVRPALIPDYRGDAVGLVAFGIGLRLR